MGRGRSWPAHSVPALAQEVGPGGTAWPKDARPVRLRHHVASYERSAVYERISAPTGHQVIKSGGRVGASGGGGKAGQGRARQRASVATLCIGPLAAIGGHRRRVAPRATQRQWNATDVTLCLDCPFITGWRRQAQAARRATIASQRHRRPKRGPGRGLYADACAGERARLERHKGWEERWRTN